MGSAVLLGLYDVAKKKSLQRNGVLWVLFFSTGLSALLLSPFLCRLPFADHLLLIFKSLLVALSWTAGLIAMGRIPLTTVSTVKASRPMFVAVLSIAVFGERLSVMQVVGAVFVLAGLMVASLSSKKEGIDIRTSRKGVVCLILSVVFGVSSALLDKYIMRWMEPLAVQSWCDLYITAIVGAALLCRRALDGRGSDGHPTFDWWLIAVALLITGADALYFFALNCDGALLSVISVARRASVAVTFAVSAVVWKEGCLRGKAAAMVAVLAGLVILVLGTI